MAKMVALKLTLFGVPRAEADGEPAKVAWRKGLALLAYLAAGEVGQRDMVAALLWPDSDETRARANLRRTLHALNQTPFGGWLDADAETVSLLPAAADHIDVARFRRLIHEDDAAARAQAADLFQGDFLEGFSLPDAAPFDEWAAQQRRQFREQALSAMHRLGEAALARGDAATAEAYARRQLHTDNLRERAWRQLLSALIAGGRRTAAIVEYERLEALLARELGVGPAPATQALIAPLRDAAAPAPAPPAFRHHLPAPASPLVGRREELAQLATWVRDAAHRLITLSGVGGVGKTRLALALGAAVRDDFRHGVHFVSLEALESPAHIAPTVAGGLELTLVEGRPARDQLLDFLEKRHLLLILDNLEHLLPTDTADAAPDGLVELLAALLAVAPDLAIVATSRERLRLPGEQVFALDGLPVGVPGAQPDGNDAVALFCQRAERVRREALPFSDADLDRIHQLCTLVEGMPLAIELAAAQLRVLPPAAILGSVADGLDAFDAGFRMLDPRHQSMRAVFAASWRTLVPAERHALARLSVFRGGFTHDAAAAVAGANLADMTALVDKSLVQRSGPDRFRLHALVRHFTAEKLETFPAEPAQTQDRHCAYYRALLHTALDEGAPGRDAIRPDLDNLRAAWRWSLSALHWDALAAYLDDLWRLFRREHRVAEAMELLEQALARGEAADPPAPARQRAHWERLLGEGYLWLSQLQAGDRHLQRAVALLGFPLPGNPMAARTGLLAELTRQALHRAVPSLFIGRRARDKAALHEAAAVYERLAERAAIENEGALGAYCAFRGLNLAEAAGVQPMMARAYGLVGLIFGLIPVHRVGRAYLQRASASAGRDPSPIVRERVARWSGIYYAGAGAWEQAAALLAASAEAAAALGEHWTKEISLVASLAVAYWRGDWEGASTLARTVGASARPRQDAGFIAAALYWEGIIALREEDANEALRLLEEAAAAPPEVMNSFDWILVHGALAQGYLRQGNREQAVAHAASGAELIAAADRPSNALSLFGYGSVAAAYLQLWETAQDGDEAGAWAAAARQLRAALQRFARVFPIGAPRAALVTGYCAWLGSEPARALRAWQQSLQAAERLTMPYEEGLAHLALGRYFLGGDDGAEVDAARHLQQAAARFAALGAGHDLAQAQALQATVAAK